MRPVVTSGLVAVLALSCFAAPSEAQLKTLETEQMRLLYFSPSLDYLAKYTARCLINSMEFQRRVYGFESPEKLTVMLRDFSDRGNAGAGAIPRNSVVFDVAPADVSFGHITTGENIYAASNHELVHIAGFDKAAARDRSFRRLLRGKVMPISEHPETLLYQYLTAPRVAVPRWYTEGIAVFSDTWMAGGLGRAQGSYDEMVFRSMVLDDTHFYDPLGLVAEGVTIDFHVMAKAYLYGTRFMTYLAYEYSPDHLVRWISRTDDSKAYYSTQFRQVFGVSLAEAWQGWLEFERGFQQANLERIREFPVTPFEDLSERALGFISRAYYDREKNTMYAGFNYPGVVSHIGAISLDDGSLERLIDIKGPARYSVSSLAYDPVDEKIFFTTDHYAYRDLRVLNLATGKARILLKEARIGELVFDRNDRSLWGVRHLNGIASLVRIPYPYEEWNQIRSWPFGEAIFDIDISPDSSLLSASVGDISGDNDLEVFRVEDLRNEELSQDDLIPIAELDVATSIPMGFVFSPDGRYLYGSSYYTGAANIFRLEVATNEFDVLTNTETGFFRPIPMGDDRLLVFRYTGEGFVPATIEVSPIEDVNAITFLGRKVIERHPILEQWQVGSPADVPIESLIIEEGEYGTFEPMKLESIYPVVVGYKNTAAAGFRINLSDYVGINRAHLLATYSDDSELQSDERFHLEFEYERYDWRLSYWHNYADFYDLFGPTKRSRKGYSIGVNWDKMLIFDEPREMELTLDSVFYGDLEELPASQGIPSISDQLWESAVSLRYENLRGSLAQVDDEKGVSWEIVADGSYVESSLIPRLRLDFDAGFPLFSHSSLWLRTSLGAADGDLDDPFAKFFFGGFGNNWLDRLEVKRYREHYAFPGLEISEIGGRNYGKIMLDWNLPPIRFREVGWQSFYATWARTSIFAGGLVTDPDVSAVRREIADLGIQVDIKLTALSRSNLTLSLGYAVAAESGFDDRDEWMASLKVF